MLQNHHLTLSFLIMPYLCNLSNEFRVRHTNSAYSVVMKYCLIKIIINIIITVAGDVDVAVVTAVIAIVIMKAACKLG